MPERDRETEKEREKAPHHRAWSHCNSFSSISPCFQDLGYMDTESGVFFMFLGLGLELCSAMSDLAPLTMSLVRIACFRVVVFWCSLLISALLLLLKSFTFSFKELWWVTHNHWNFYACFLLEITMVALGRVFLWGKRSLGLWIYHSIIYFISWVSVDPTVKFCICSTWSQSPIVLVVHYITRILILPLKVFHT